MMVLSTVGAQMLGWNAGRASRQLEERMAVLEKQARVALDTDKAQHELVMALSERLELLEDVAFGAVKDAHRADAIGLITMTALAAVMAHVAAGLQPHPEAKRQFDLFLKVADKVVDSLASERPKTAGGFQAQAL